MEKKLDKRMDDLGSHLLVLGAGYTALAAIKQIRDRFDKVTATSRTVQKCLELAAHHKIQSLEFDGKCASAQLIDAVQDASHILVSIAPNDSGDPVLNSLAEAMGNATKLKWIGYLSTVGVYGDHDGAWVDETTPPQPQSLRSKQRLAAEGDWQRLADRLGLSLSILRLSGIYGPGRNGFINIEKGRSRRLVKAGQVFNRIHRDDIVTAIERAMEHHYHGILNITDDCPAPPQDVVTYAHALYGTSPPDPIDFETAPLSPMARSFYGENKRVRNARSKAELGMEYRWPDYKTALNHMWAEDCWR